MQWSMSSFCSSAGMSPLFWIISEISSNSCSNSFLLISTSEKSRLSVKSASRLPSLGRDSELLARVGCRVSYYYDSISLRMSSRLLWQRSITLVIVDRLWFG